MQEFQIHEDPLIFYKRNYEGTQVQKKDQPSKATTKEVEMEPVDEAKQSLSASKKD